MTATVTIDRNNTNFPLKLTEYLKNAKIGDEFAFLKYYQQLVREYVINVRAGARGILIDHSMGLGKTITAIAIAMELYDTSPTIVLLTKALKQNFRDNIIKYILMRSKGDPYYQIGKLSPTDMNAFIDKNFSFVHVNAGNMIQQLAVASEGFAGTEFDKFLNKKLKKIIKLGSLDDKLLIVDEAHNLFRAIINGSSNALKLYDMIMIAKNLKLIFLTGTPISTNPFQLVPCFNMLGVDESRQLPLLPELYVDFLKLYIDPGQILKTGEVAAKRMKNKNMFQNRIMGLVSFVNAESSLVGAVDIPKQLPTIVLKLPMTAEQYAIYILAREREKDEAKRNVIGQTQIRSYAAMTLPKSDKSSSYRVRSRHLSNFCPPPAFRDFKFSEMNINEIPAHSVTSPKLEAILKIVGDHPERIGILYSQFVGVGGLGIVARFLTLNKWKRWTSTITKVGGNEIIDCCGGLCKCISVNGGCCDNLIGGGWSSVQSCGCKNVNPDFSMKPNSVFIIYSHKLVGSTDKYSWSEATAKDLDAIRKLDTDKKINYGKDYNNCIEFPYKILQLFEDSQLVGYATLKYKKTLIAIHNISTRGDIKNDSSDCAMFTLFELLREFAHNEYTTLTVKISRRCPYAQHDLEIYKLFSPTRIEAKGIKTKLIFAPVAPKKSVELKKYFEKCKKIKKVRGGADDKKIVDDIDDGDRELEIKELPADELKKIIDTTRKEKSKEQKTFAIISGETPEADISQIISVYNSDDNKYGGLIDLLLISASGAEGLDLKNGAYAIIMEPYWTYSRISQFISRLVRIGSHSVMPADARTVQPYILLAVDPIAETDPPELTTDLELYQESLTQNTLIKEFLGAIREVSIECILSGAQGCRVCSPTDMPLFTWDPDADVLSADPCTHVTEHTVKALEVELNGVKYYYATAADSIAGYVIYEYDESISAYRKMPENAPHFQIILEIIKNKSAYT